MYAIFLAVGPLFTLIILNTLIIGKYSIFPQVAENKLTLASVFFLIITQHKKKHTVCFGKFYSYINY